jgi:pimeloyl-ACP methyl ester carboxylesterase
MTRRTTIFLLVAVLALAAVAAAAFVLQRTSAERISLDVLEARYTTPASRFVVVEGVRVHYVDEGSGPVLVLFHGSFGSLRAFDELAATLRPMYRVIRFDQAPAGLSGPVPAGFALTPEAFTHALLQRLGATKVAVLGTSSGGIYAYRYAASYPEDVTAVVLASVPPSAPVDNAGAQRRLPWLTRLSMQLCQKRARPWSRRCWQDFLGHTMARAEHAGPARIDQYYDMNRRPDSQAMNSMTAIMRDDALVRGFLERVRAPVLLIWGDRGNVLPPETASILARRLTGTTVRTELLERVAHYPPMDAPDEVAALVDSFLRQVAAPAPLPTPATQPQG